MLGAIQIVWKSNGEVVKDQTVPYNLSAIEKIGDTVTIKGFGVPDTVLDVEFTFNPVVSP